MSPDELNDLIARWKQAEATAEETRDPDDARVAQQLLYAVRNARYDLERKGRSK